MTDELTPETVRERLEEAYEKSKTRPIIHRNIADAPKCEKNALLRFLIMERYRHSDDIEFIDRCICDIVNGDDEIEFRAFVQRIFVETK